MLQDPTIPVDNGKSFATIAILPRAAGHITLLIRMPVGTRFERNTPTVWCDNIFLRIRLAQITNPKPASTEFLNNDSEDTGYRPERGIFKEQTVALPTIRE